MTDTAELRHRGVGEVEPKAGTASVSDEKSAITTTLDSEDDDRIVTEESLEQLTKDLPQATDHTTEALDSALSGLSARWRNWVIRGIFSFIMIAGFTWLIYMGPVALMATVLAIQIKCFQEIIAIGHAVYRVHDRDLPWFRTLSWYLLLCSNYYFFGEAQIDYWGTVLNKDDFLNFFISHHRFISFGLYIVGFMWFVLSLKKGYYMRQFSLFAWTHVTLLLIVTQSYLIIKNIFQGMIWFLVPVSMIICNDIMAYMFGFFLGKTPLIKLSPKKTWEGFIGGGVSTIIFGVIMSYVLLHYPFFVCPLEYGGVEECAAPPSFRLRHFAAPRPLSFLLQLVGRQPVLKVYPVLLHMLVIGLFTSLVGPFGGFFASGFKRAFKIKDFGAVIPGHGGLMDRFDCQLIIGSFVNVYIQTFISTPNPAKLVQQILLLRPDEQVQVFDLLRQTLTANGLLDNHTVPLE